MLYGKMSSDSELRDLETVRNWAVQQNPTKNTTTHWWVSQLGQDAKNAFHRLENSHTIRELFNEKFNLDNYSYEPVNRMNELYISGPNREGTSDQVFFTEHIDGPFYLFPFASVYRCIVGMDANTEISTVFKNKSFVLQKGDILAFDFNREPHYIESDPSKPNKDYRIVMKLHYCVYPKQLRWLGKTLKWLTAKYDEIARRLFISTLNPKTAISIMAGVLVNAITRTFNAVHMYIGYNNALYLIMCLCISRQTNSFLWLTQYVHYCRYITTYYIRKDVDYETFKRDVFLFKCVALSQIAYIVWKQRQYCNWLWCVPIIIGYAISGLATNALGLDGTYFGIELGIVKADYNFVTTFPYNVIPHPMIVGQIVGLFGIHQMIKHQYTWLIPLHIMFYTIHMIQEIYDIHDGIPYYKK